MQKKSKAAKRPVSAGKSAIASREEATLAFWNERKIFEKSLKKPSPKGDYIFYDGPPFATGLPHYGHIVASVIKDVVPRYFTMRGYRCPRVWGWDCHGLPIENIVEKELGFKHKKDIKEYGIAKFNEYCRSRVLTYAAEWEKIIPRIGRWADMKGAYRTMDKPFMESVWWVFKELWNKGLIYEDYRSMHICPRCETTLSQQEVAEGYKDVKDIAVTVKFKVKNPQKIGLSGNVYLLAWTTTPWTLPGNVALAVGRNIEYTDISVGYEKYIVAKERAGSTVNGEIGKTYKGAELVGLEYEPLFDYYANDKNLKHRENGWKVYAADFITTDTGTGIAHEAPAFGADDWELAKKVRLPFIQHVNMDGTIKPEAGDFAGLEAKPNSEDDHVRLGTDIAILKYLQEHGALFAKENIVHSYPHCWRCDTPLLNYATSSWFVSITKIKENLLKNAEKINWSPEHLKKGRFGDWLLGARDWSISRQRFWASVIPIWRCEACKKLRVFGSASELEAASGKKVEDLHKHVVDEITVPCLPSEALAKEGACGGVMRRVPDVLDTWFDSGSMPYGEKHYPFDFAQGKPFEFPAKFIAEGLDQTRAWFYYLHVLAAALFKKNAFQNVIVNGIVLAADGKKMAKKLQNYPDPMEVVDKYGADALRFYLLSSPVMRAENLSFSETGVDEVARKNIGRLGNVLSFYQLYASDVKRGAKSTHVLDRWILARLDELVQETTEGFEKYQLDAATRPIIGFIDDLSVWYLRRSRERFKEGGNDTKLALSTLRHVLHTLSLVIAPSMPFLAEHIFQTVKEEGDVESAHLAKWPKAPRRGFLASIFHKKDQMLADMSSARAIVTQALEARDKAGIKVRQPLASLSIPASSRLPKEYLAIIADEVNVKQVRAEGDAVALDTHITDELREEGVVRDAKRLLQDHRRLVALKPSDIVREIELSFPPKEAGILQKHIVELQKMANLQKLIITPREGPPCVSRISGESTG